MKEQVGGINHYNHEYEELRIIQIIRMSEWKYRRRKRPIFTDNQYNGMLASKEYLNGINN